MLCSSKLLIIHLFMMSTTFTKGLSLLITWLPSPHLYHMPGPGQCRHHQKVLPLLPKSREHSPKPHSHRPPIIPTRYKRTDEIVCWALNSKNFVINVNCTFNFAQSSLNLVNILKHYPTLKERCILYSRPNLGQERPKTWTTAVSSFWHRVNSCARDCSDKWEKPLMRRHPIITKPSLKHLLSTQPTINMKQWSTTITNLNFPMAAVLPWMAIFLLKNKKVGLTVWRNRLYQQRFQVVGNIISHFQVLVLEVQCKVQRGSSILILFSKDILAPNKT